MGRPLIVKPLDYLKRALDRRYKGIRIRRSFPERTSEKKLKVADVIFCFGGMPHIPWQIIKYGSSGPYVHVGIYLGNKCIAEATTDGVKAAKLEDFLSRYEYVAVTRCPGVDGIPNLRRNVYNFCTDHIRQKTRYDFVGASLSPLFELFDLLHQRIRYRTIRFNWPRNKRRTFCSQFVLDAFVAGGYIVPNDFSLGARSPTALAEDNFLYFIGYLSTKKDLMPLIKNDFFWTGGG